MAISMRVRDDFQLVHEPIPVDREGIYYEEADIAQKLRDRLEHSTGGTFLITGFRGVGKTTAVQQALRQLSDGKSPRRVIDVVVPVARPTTTAALMFEVTRRLVERLAAAGVLRTLSPQVRDPLLTAYARTSLAYRQTSTKSEETTTTIGFGGQVSTGKQGLSLPVPKLGRSRSRAESTATDISFLAYSEADVEHDFLRIVELLGRPDAVRRGRLARLASRVGFGSSAVPLQAQIVVVFDEIDKLTEADGGLEAFEAMLSGLKNLLAAPGVHFVVVGGVDLHDEWLRESATANSLYRSVFAWQGYVGCSWRAAARLLDETLVAVSPRDREILAGYLQYRGRGVIRNVLYELNELIEWDPAGPFIEISGTAEDRVRLLSELARVLEQRIGEATDSVLAVPSDNDRIKQVAYFTADWVLRAGREVFTVEDVMDPARGTPLDSVLQPSEEIVHSVLTALASNEYLDVEARDAEFATQGPDAERYRERYSLSRQLLERLAVIAQASPRARAEFGEEQISTSAEGGSDPLKRAQQLIGPRYHVIERIGEGGFGTVWKGVDETDGSLVAIKVVRTPGSDAKDRVRVESELLRQAEGLVGVVRIRDFFFAGDRAILVTEFVGGESLANLMVQPPPIAVEIATFVLRTVEALHERGIIHADLKPSNIILLEDRRPVLMDLGTATWAMGGPPDRLEATRDTTIFGVSGTPAYMAPELFMGATPSVATDVWAVGILLLELLIGAVPPRRTRDVLVEVVRALTVSDALQFAILRALEVDPQARPSAAQFREELRQTPEGQHLMDPRAGES